MPTFDPPSNRGVRNAVRRRESNTEESGGEEILYKPPVPRAKLDQAKTGPQQQQTLLQSPVNSSFSSASITSPRTSDEPSIPQASTPSSPPSSFSTHPGPHKAKKRTSDEFERDQFGVLISKTTGLSLHGGSAAGSDKEDRDRVARRHRSTGVGSPALKDRPRDRRRTDSTGMGLGSIGRAGRSASGHSHQGSASSVETRRVFSTDFAQLTSSASMSTTPPGHHLRQSDINPSGNISTDGDTPRRPTVATHHSSPSVAHSLLRGTQEGWSALDDTATVEALRKLDGIPGRSLRGRSSMGSSRPNSRPNTPASRGGLAAAGWEGREAISNGREHRESHKDVHSSSHDTSGREREREPTSLMSPSSTHENSDPSDDFPSQDEPTLHAPHFVQAKHSSKDYHAASSPRTTSYALKRGSASSTSATTGTPTTSSRDSMTLSTTTSATSNSALSHRNSGGKLRRSSGGSDISSVNSEFLALKDRAAALASGEGGDDGENARIPPVPPLPKAYQSPSASNFNVQPLSPRAVSPPLGTPGDDDRTFTIPTIDLPPATPGKTTATRPHTQPSPARGPTKKWSFTNPLSLKSPGKEKEGSKSPGTPRKVKAGRQSTGSSYTSSEPWSVVDSPNTNVSHSNLYASPSIASLKPISDTTSPTPTTTVKARTPDRSTPSRTESSASTQTTSQALRSATSPPIKGGPPPSKRLTPSNIPFFRRSSSASMKAAPAIVHNGSPPVPSYLSHHASNISISTTASKSTNSLDIISPTSSDPPAMPQATRKSSVLSFMKGSSSRKSMSSEKMETKVREEREKEAPIKEEPAESKQKKDDKERSESRISILMGRKRGKVSIYSN